MFELLCNPELMPEWDMLVKGASYLSSAVDEAGRCQVATLRVVYGLPGARGCGARTHACMHALHARPAGADTHTPRADA